MEQPMEDGQPTRSSRRPDPAELSVSEDRAELNDELSTIERHCQLFDDMLNASKPSETSQSNREVLKVMIFGSLFGSYRSIKLSSLIDGEVPAVPISHNDFGN